MNTSNQNTQLYLDPELWYSGLKKSWEGDDCSRWYLNGMPWGLIISNVFICFIVEENCSYQVIKLSIWILSWVEVLDALGENLPCLTPGRQARKGPREKMNKGSERYQKKWCQKQTCNYWIILLNFVSFKIFSPHESLMFKSWSTFPAKPSSALPHQDCVLGFELASRVLY